MTADWNPVTAEEISDNSHEEQTAPDLTIFDIPEKVFGTIPQIKNVNFYPTRAARKCDPRTRQTVLVLVVNRDTGGVPIVQSAKAGIDDWSLIQGGIESNETALAAVSREAREETGINLTEVKYVFSYRAPVDKSAHKKQYFDYQLFHCFVACTRDVAVNAQCAGVAAAAVIHEVDVLPMLWRSASAVKQVLLPPLFQAAVEYEFMSPRACRRE